MVHISIILENVIHLHQLKNMYLHIIQNLPRPVLHHPGLTENTEIYGSLFWSSFANKEHINFESAYPAGVFDPDPNKRYFNKNICTFHPIRKKRLQSKVLAHHHHNIEFISKNIFFFTKYLCSWLEIVSCDNFLRPLVVL